MYFQQNKFKNKGVKWHRNWYDISYYKNGEHVSVSKNKDDNFEGKFNKSRRDSFEIDYDRDFSGTKFSSLNMFEQMLAKEDKTENSLAKKSKAMYSLTFTYDFEYDNDIVFFAHWFPYTASDCCEFLDQIQKKTDQKDILKRDILCATLGGRPWHMLTITENISTYMNSNEEKNYFANFKKDLIEEDFFWSNF